MDDPTTAILNTPSQALCTHGSTALTARNIAAEWSMSKASSHYRYDGKDDPFIALPDSLPDRLDAVGDHRPRDRLCSLLLTTDQGEDRLSGAMCDPIEMDLLVEPTAEGRQ